MTAIPILKMGNPILQAIAADINDPVSEEIRNLVEVMRESMDAAGGIGLAAPQIGESLRLVIFEVPAERLQKEDEAAQDDVPSTILINPIITPVGDEKDWGWEGCLSVPGMRGLVPRYIRVRYSGLNIDGEPVSGEASGFHARVIQHECDHLDGILYPERMTNLKHLVYESEIQAFMESYTAPVE
ncbi:MAG: peptide deformylase [Sneathiella sp.]